MAYIIIAAALALALALNGCAWVESWSPREAKHIPPYEGVGYTHREPTVQEQILAASDFSVELVRFEDTRYPRSTAFAAPDELVHEYEPDELLQGVSYRVPVLLNKYLAYRPRMTKHYKVEMELLTLQTRIQSGDMRNGRFGSYHVKLEAKVIARRPDSRVVLNRIIRLEDQQKRDTFNGRNPTREMDRARMYDLTEAMIRRFAEETAWDIRRFDAKRWAPAREAQQRMKEAKSDEVKIRASQPPVTNKPPTTFLDSAPENVTDEPTTIQDLITPPAPTTEPTPPIDETDIKV